MVYAYLDGEMWDRRVPSATELHALADMWICLHSLPSEGLWLARGQARTHESVGARFRAPIAAYAEWAALQPARYRTTARLCEQALERGLAEGIPLIPEVVPLCFCRSDPRFANVIARPDGRLALVDWEDSGLRDPARELADLLCHPNQEDLLGPAAWQPFLDRYLPSRSDDVGLRDRLRGYLLLFPVFWLGGLLGQGMGRVTGGTLDPTWLVNGMPPNERLRRYLARCLAWPSPDPSSSMANLADLEFFPT